MGKDIGIGMLCMGLWGIPWDMPVISLWALGCQRHRDWYCILFKGLCGVP